MLRHASNKQSGFAIAAIIAALVVISVGGIILFKKESIFVTTESVGTAPVPETTDEPVDLKEQISEIGRTIQENWENFLGLNQAVKASEIISFTNQARQGLGISPPLIEDPLLTEIAKRRLDDMFAKQYFDHVAPDGTDAAAVAESVGYDYLNIAENLALGRFETAQEMVDDWMNSPGHRANIVNSKFSRIGVAIRYDEYENRKVWLGVQIFARPADACPEPSVTEKRLIDLEDNALDGLKIKLDLLQVTINNLKYDPNRNQGELEQQVSEYNQLVNEYNERSDDLEDRVDDYNRAVRVFNSCLNN